MTALRPAGRTQMSLVPTVVPESEGESPDDVEEGAIAPWGVLRDEALDLWESGIFSDMSFVYIALKIDQEDGVAFDLDNFIFRWQTMPDPDSGKNKVLKQKSVIGALEKFQKLEKLEIRKASVQLTLLEGF